MTNSFVQVPPDSTGKFIDNAQYTIAGRTVQRQRVDAFNANPVNIDLDGATRVSQKITAFDGRIYGSENTLKWDTKGTGTATYSNNAINMAVTAGQYLVRQGKIFCNYFSGKPLVFEETAFNFQSQQGVIKRMGYFSSSAVAPYSADLDGIWLESDGVTHRLICSNNGVETHNIPWDQWDAVVNGDVTSYDWSKFTVIKGTFLWLGGAGAQLFLVINGAFVLMHTIKDHAGYSDTLIMLNPNQPVRYEIRSTGGAGSMVSVCSQATSEGIEENEQSQYFAAYAPQRTANALNTIYPLIGARKLAVNRNSFIEIASAGAAILTNDTGILLVMLNPTLSAPMTWSTNSKIQIGLPALNSTATVGTGRILQATPLQATAQVIETSRSYLRHLTTGIDNAMGEIVVAYQPLTTNQDVVGIINVAEF